MTWTYLLNSRSDVLHTFLNFKQLIENQTLNKIKAIRTDNALEFCSKEWESTMHKFGIIHELSAAYCHYQNGVAERMNRTLEEMTRCMLHESGLPKSLWGEAVMTSTYLRNRLPSSSNAGKTPYEIFTGKIPNLSHAKQFGTQCFVHVDASQRNKLEPSAKEGYRVGYRQERETIVSI